MTGPLKMDVGTRNTERKGVNGEDKKGLTERQEKARFRNRGRRAKTMGRRKVQRVVEASAIRKEERKRVCLRRRRDVVGMSERVASLLAVALEIST